MRLQNVNKNVQKEIALRFSQSALKHPHFMLLCPNINKRPKYIAKYFEYHMSHDMEKDAVYVSEDLNAAAFVVEIEKYMKPPSGSYAMSLFKSHLMSPLKEHIEVVSGITDILVPRGREIKIMNVFGDSSTGIDSMIQIVNEAMATAKRDNTVLIYETLSKRLVPQLKGMGFEIGYQKQYLNTQYFQSLMVYNV